MNMNIDSLPRCNLAQLPTPVQELDRLTKELKGPKLLVKRDDQTGLAFGGNKTRKLELLIADALNKGADTVITVGAVQSNHSRATALAAARLGVRTILLLRKEPGASAPLTGNYLLDYLAGAEIRFITPQQWEQRNELMQAEAQRQFGALAQATGGTLPRT